MTEATNPNNAKPSRFEDIDPEGQAKLMDMAYGRLVHSISMVPIAGLAFGYWQYKLELNPHGLWLWSLSYLLAAAAVRLQRKQYLREREQMPTRQNLAKWLPMVNGMAIVHGLGLAAIGVITAGRVPYHFTMLEAVVITGIVAANASQLSPVLVAFRRFACAVWLPCMMIAPWALPDHWGLVVPFSAVMLFTLDRQAVVSHGFFLHQITLEQ